MEICTECNCKITQGVFDFSVENIGVPLCMPHQKWLSEIEENTTAENLTLYFALKQRGVPASIEHYDGHKHIDIVIHEAKVHIEVDGRQHFNHKQALSDLKRTYYSFLEGYFTLRIPNTLVHEHLDETAEYLVSFMNESYKRVHELYSGTTYRLLKCSTR